MANRESETRWPDVLNAGATLNETSANDPLARDADFQAAQVALRKGEYDEALRLSQRVLYTFKDDQRASSRVFALRASAYCGKRDLGNAKAMLRRVEPQHQRKARELCARLGQSL